MCYTHTMKSKPPVRFRIEFVDPDGNTVWHCLASSLPPDLRCCRPVRPSPRGRADSQLIYSEHDPLASVIAARQAALHRATCRSLCLNLLIDAHFDGTGPVPKRKLQEVGGDSADRRVRELRADGWPIETVVNPDGAWHYQINLPAIVGGGEQQAMFDQ